MKLLYFLFLLVFMHTNAQDNTVQFDTISTQKIQTDPDRVYNSNEVDKKPEYSEGIEKYYKLFRKKFWIPTSVKNQTNVIMLQLMFIVEKNGTISNIKTITTGFHGPVSDALVKEAEKALLKMPKWTPGELNGEPVRVKMNLPIKLNIKDRNN